MKTYLKIRPLVDRRAKKIRPAAMLANVEKPVKMKLRVRKT